MQARPDEEHGYAAMPSQPPDGKQQQQVQSQAMQPPSRRRLMRSIECLLAALYTVLMLLLVATWTLPAVRAHLRTTARLQLHALESSCRGRPCTWLLPSVLWAMAAVDAVCLCCWFSIMLRIWQDCCERNNGVHACPPCLHSNQLAPACALPPADALCTAVLCAAEAGSAKGGCHDDADEEEWQWDAMRLWPLDWVLGAALLLNTLCMAALPLVGCD